MHTQPTASAGATVLIVDDDREAVESFSQMLRLSGYQVRVAQDPERGLQEALSGDLDAIILDLHMPLLDGVAFLRRLRDVPARRDVPVAIVTGDYLLDERVIAEVRALGVRIVYKPLWLEDLVELTESLVSPRR